jgi:hypothetical protein
MPHDWNFEERFRFTLQLALRKALKLVGLKRRVSEVDERMMASAIADHLRLANYDISERGPAESLGHVLRGPSEKGETEEA